MSAHTPGPWKVEYSEGDEWEVLAGANLPIAYISGWAGRSIEANARLIAAAPDLLVALKRLEDLAGQIGPRIIIPKAEHGTIRIIAELGALADACTAARAAIAKAEGQS